MKPTLDGLQFGLVSQLDYLNCRVKVRLDEFEGLESWWLQVPQRHSKASKSRPLLPELGEQVAVLLQQDGINGVVLGGVYSQAEPPPVTDKHSEFVRFSDGSEVSYNRQSHQLRVNSVGSLLFEAATSIQLTAGSQITLNAPRIDLN